MSPRGFNHSRWSRRWVAIGLLGLGLVSIWILNGTEGSRRAASVLARLRRAYADRPAYACSGTVVEESGGRMSNGTFLMRLARSDQYRLEYTFKNPFYTNQGAVWGDGKAQFFADDLTGISGPLQSRNSASNWEMVDGLAGGFTHVVPELFAGRLPSEFEPSTSLWRWVPRSWKPRRRSWELKEDETLDGVRCWVLSAVAGEVKEEWWIGQDDDFIRQTRWTRRPRLGSVSETDWKNFLAQQPAGLVTDPPALRRALNDARRRADETRQPATVALPTTKPGPGIKEVTVAPLPVTIRTQRYQSVDGSPTLSPADFVHSKP